MRTIVYRNPLGSLYSSTPENEEQMNKLIASLDYSGLEWWLI